MLQPNEEFEHFQNWVKDQSPDEVIDLPENADEIFQTLSDMMDPAKGYNAELDREVLRRFNPTEPKNWKELDREWLELHDPEALA